MYTPVAQRKTTISPVAGGGVSPVSGGGYVPVAQRTTITAPKNFMTISAPSQPKVGTTGLITLSPTDLSSPSSQFSTMAPPTEADKQLPVSLEKRITDFAKDQYRQTKESVPYMKQSFMEVNENPALAGQFAVKLISDLNNRAIDLGTFLSKVSPIRLFDVATGGYKKSVQDIESVAGSLKKNLTDQSVPTTPTEKIISGGANFTGFAIEQVALAKGIEGLMAPLKVGTPNANLYKYGFGDLATKAGLEGDKVMEATLRAVDPTKIKNMGDYIATARAITGSNPKVLAHIPNGVKTIMSWSNTVLQPEYAKTFGVVAAPKLPRVYKSMADMISFMGIGQIEYKPGEESRMQRALTDAAMILAFEGAAKVLSTLSKPAQKVLGSIKEGIKVKLPELESALTELRTNQAGFARLPGTKPEISPDLKQIADNAKKMNLTKEEFVSEFDKALKDKNLTKRDDAQRVMDDIKKNQLTLEQFYDTQVKPLQEAGKSELIAKVKEFNFKSAKSFTDHEFSMWMSKLPAEEKLAAYNSQSIRTAKYDEMLKELTPIWKEAQIGKVKIAKTYGGKLENDAYIEGGKVIFGNKPIELKKSVIWSGDEGLTKEQLVSKLEEQAFPPKRFLNEPGIKEMSEKAQVALHNIKMKSEGWESYKTNWNKANQSKAVGEVKPALKVEDTFESGVKNYPPTTQGIQNKIAAETGRIIKTEEQLIKDSLRAEARGIKIGVKVGTQEARESIINQLKNTFETKLAGVKRGNELAVLKTKIVGREADRVRTEIVNYVKQNIPTTEQGKFIVMVKNSETQKDLTKAFLRIDAKANQVAVKDAVTTLKKTVDRLAESPSVSADYRKKIKDIINQYELSGHTGATIKKLEATQAYLEGIKASGGETYIPDKILEKLQILSRTPRNKLTLSQVQGLQNEIELLGKLGQTKWASKQALYEGEKALRKQALLDSATPINSLLSAKGEIGSDPKKWSEAYIKTRNYLQKTNIGLKPIDGLADITGMQPMKQALDLNYGNFIDRNIPEVADFKKLEEDMLESGSKLSTGSRERVGVFGHAKQEGGYEKLLNSGITKEKADAIVLTAEEQKFYDAIQKFNESSYPAVKKYAMDTYNVDVGKVDNYMSYMTDYEAMGDLEMYNRFGNRAEDMITNRRTKKVEESFTKARVGAGTQKVQLDALKIAQRHADDVAYMLTMGKDIKQYSEIVYSPEVREKLGDVGALAWLQYLDLMARKGGSEGAKRLAALDVLRRNIGAGILSFRLSSALVQFTSFADTMGTIGVEYATKGASRIATSKEWRQFILNNFPEVRKAIGDDIAFREFGDGFMGKFAKVGTKPLQVLDGLMRSTAVAGAYEKLAIERGIAVDLLHPDKQLIQDATALMRKSQGSSFFKDQPLALTTGFGLLENKSLNKAALTFQSFMLNRWDNMNRQIWRMGIKEGNYKKAAASFFWMVIFAAAAEEGIRRGTRSALNLVTGDSQPEQSFTENSILNVVQTVPIAGSLVSALTYSSNPVPIINTAEDLLTGAGTVVKGKAGSTKAKGAVQAIGAAGSLAGVAGSSQAAQIIKKIISSTTATAPSSSSKSSSGVKRLKTPTGLPSLPKFQLPTPPGLPKLPKL